MPKVSKRLILYPFMVFSLCCLFGAMPVDTEAAVPVAGMDPAGYPAPNVGCLATDKCHTGIEPIRSHDSRMAREIYAKGATLGDPNGCVVCHGGNPKEEKEAKIAHSGAPEGRFVYQLIAK